MNFRFLKNNKEIKNAGWLIFGKVGQMLISLFVGILTARYLGPSNYGLISYASAYVAFFSSFCTLGINSIIIKDFVDNPQDEGTAIGSSLVLRALSSLLSSITIILIVAILDKDESQTIVVTSLCSISLIFQIFDTFTYWFQAKYLSKITAIATFSAYTIVSIYKVILLLLNKSVEWFAFATSLDFICLGIFLYFVYKKYKGPKLRFSFSKSRALLSRSYNFILSGMMVAIYGQTDKLMIKQMLDEAEVGYYSIGTTISSMWVFILAAIIQSIYPTIMQLHRTNKEAYIRKNIQLYSIVIYLSFSASLLFTIAGDQIVNIMYGEEFKNSSNVLKLITWYTAFSYLGVARNAWIVCEHKQKYLKYIYLAAAVLNVSCNLIFIPIYGACGAALASLVTEISTSIILPFFIKEMRENSIMILKSFVFKFG